MTLQYSLESNAPSAFKAVRTSPREPHRATSREERRSGGGPAAPALLDSPLPDGRFVRVAEGGSKVLIRFIEDLRSRGYRRVDGAPSRVNEFSAECIDSATHQYRLVWIEPRPARRPKGAADAEVS